jgi:hypothetical protein
MKPRLDSVLRKADLKVVIRVARFFCWPFPLRGNAGFPSSVEGRECVPIEIDSSLRRHANLRAWSGDSRESGKLLTMIGNALSVPHWHPLLNSGRVVYQVLQRNETAELAE